MAGHSKWANIKHRKAAADAKKGKITTKIVREITVAARLAGGDIESNPRLRLAIEKAKENNVPKENIERAVKKGAGESDGSNYVELRFEGYAAGGVAVVVDCLTDNNIRTISDVKCVFNKQGANIGSAGCVAFQFKPAGEMLFLGISDVDNFFNIAIEAGASDVQIQEDNSVEVLTEFNDFHKVKEFLIEKGFIPEFSRTTMRPDSYTDLDDDQAQKFQKFVDALEDLDDVQEVYHNAIY
jgi:YebC/PmpR family DNA-binding regulatory protein